MTESNVDEQHLEKHVLFIQRVNSTWVKSKRGVYCMHVEDDDELLIGGNYIGTAPASSIFCTTFINKSPFLVFRL